MTPITIQGKYTNAVVMTQTAESSSLDQIRTMINSPAFDKPVVIMPDTHAGKGSVVGFTMPMGDKIVPNCIGVDIGCGIYAYELSIVKNGEMISSSNIGFDWEVVDEKIRKEVPLGFSIRNKPYKNLTIQELEQKCQAERHLTALLTKLGLNVERTLCQVGTLGGGNHFIEIAKSANTGNYWLVLHTGSRNLGKQIAEYHQKKAIEYVRGGAKAVRDFILSLPEEKRQDMIDESKLSSMEKVPEDLCFLEGTQKEEYLKDMQIAQRYAHVNKEIMAEAIASALGISFTGSKIRSVHNYIDFSDNIIRKGATRANAGELFVVPFNMRDGTLICRGKGNPQWNNSAPHGAGRVLARGNAKRTLKLEEFQETMKGIWSSSVCADTLDESPMAYKLPAEIEEAIQDTCEIVDRLIPVYNLKASEKNE